MSDLLKEAIADAKAVRETALANAKMALEEAFTPHLKSMLSAKLAEEDLEEEDVFEDEHEDEEEETDEGMHDSDRMGREDDDEEGEDDDPMKGEEVDESEIIEIDGVRYAPIVSEEEHEDEDGEEGDDDEEVDESEELDLEAVIKELEEELEEAGDPGDEEESVNEEELTEGPDDDEEEKVDEEIVNEDDEEDLEEQSTSSGIGKGSGVKQPSASDEEDPGKGKTHEQVETLQGELNEYKEAVSFLRDKLHEVNILNAKLLYTNKLFKEYVLSNDQKLKIVETFDRAQTTREIKLVYSTLAESYKDNGNEKKEVVKEFASKKSGGTAPQTKIITEESQVADRFRKLAGIIKS